MGMAWGRGNVRYAMSIQAFSTSSVIPTYFEELRGFGSVNFTREYSTSFIAGATLCQPTRPSRLVRRPLLLRRAISTTSNAGMRDSQ